MIKKNLPIIILTSIITLLPAIFLKSGFPLIIFAVHLVCIFATSKDKSNADQSQKVFRLIFWICPILGIYASGITYLTMTGRYSGIEETSIGLFGIACVVIGNYLPKCKQNATIGIRIPWTFTSEENWRQTHRLGGKVWVICGLLMMCTLFLPMKIGTIMRISLFIIMIFVPAVYSYLFYKKEKQEGKADIKNMHIGRLQTKKLGKKSIACLIAIFAGGCVMMFVGDIEYTFSETSLNIEADFWSDMEIDYEDIKSIEYLEKDAKGNRVGGYSSARLLLGTFRNETYDYHTRYSYTKCKEAILLDLGESKVIIGADTKENTEKLYEKIVDNVDCVEK